MRNGMGMGMGAGGGKAGNKPAIFTVTGSNAGTKLFNVSASTYLRVTGDTVFNSASINGGANVTAASGWVAVNMAGTNHTFTCSGNGTIEIRDRRLISYLLLEYTASSINGSITGMGLTALSLKSTGSAITGSITGMGLTVLLLPGTGSAITGCLS